MMHWKYFKYVVRHKVFVLLAGWGRVSLWRLLVHDWSKFTRLEWLGYARFFYGPHQTSVVLSPSGGRAKAPPEVSEAFDRAWLHHQQVNDHHWQHWCFLPGRPGDLPLRACNAGVLLKDDGSTLYLEEWSRGVSIVPGPMPSACREEMLADWRGAGRAVGKPDTRAWYLKNRDNMILHPETRAWVERELGIPGYWG